MQAHGRARGKFGILGQGKSVSEDVLNGRQEDSGLGGAGRGQRSAQSVRRVRRGRAQGEQRVLESSTAPAGCDGVKHRNRIGYLRRRGYGGRRRKRVRREERAGATNRGRRRPAPRTRSGSGPCATGRASCTAGPRRHFCEKRY
jgi:hypothetical protein